MEHKKKVEGRRTHHQKENVLRLARTKAIIKYSGGLEVVKNPNPMFQMRIPIEPFTLTTITGPSISNASNINVSLINGFTTRWGAVFREYMITGADLVLAATTSSYVALVGPPPVYNDVCGVAVAWIDELVGSAPSVTNAARADHVTVALNNKAGKSASRSVIKWRVSEINDLGWTVCTSSAPNPAVLMTYSDATRYQLNLPVGIQALQVDGHLLISFRGIA